jgi:hypothetical protein
MDQRLRLECAGLRRTRNNSVFGRACNTPRAGAGLVFQSVHRPFLWAGNLKEFSEKDLVSTQGQSVNNDVLREER